MKTEQQPQENKLYSIVDQKGDIIHQFVSSNPEAAIRKFMNFNKLLDGRSWEEWKKLGISVQEVNLTLVTS